MQEHQARGKVVAVRPDKEVMTKQRLPYFIGISAATAGAKGLSMHLVVIPPGAAADAHVHEHFETAIYVLEGEVRTWYGGELDESIVSAAGDFLFIPPSVPHRAVNCSQTAPARAIVARNDPSEQERVRPYTP